MDLTSDLLALAGEETGGTMADADADAAEAAEEKEAKMADAIATAVRVDTSALKTPVVVMCGSTDWVNAGKGAAGRMSQGKGKKKKGAPVVEEETEPPPQHDAPTVIGPTTWFSGARVERLATGPCASHCFAVAEDGRVFAWGSNMHGQLGLGSDNSSPSGGSGGGGASSKKKGGSKTTTTTKGSTTPPISSSNTVVLGPREAPKWRRGSHRVLSLAVGKNHTLAAYSDGVVLAAGHGAKGALGLGSGKKDVPELCASPKPVIIQGARSVAAGCDFSLAVTDKGDAYSWGWSECGKLGHGTDGQYNTKDSSVKLTFTVCGTPQKIARFVGDDDDDDAAGMKTKPARGAATTTTGAVTGNTTPFVVSISAGKHHAACVTRQGVGYTWGDGSYGKLGHKTQEQLTVPTRLRGARFTALYCGDNSTCGLGYPEYRGRPFQKPPPPQLLAGSFGAGSSENNNNNTPPPRHDGCLYVWGVLKGTHGEGATYPRAEQELAGWALATEKLAMGASHVAMHAEASAIAWAQSPVAFGQLGYGAKGPKSSHKPQKLRDLDGAVECAQVAAFAGATLYLLDRDDPVVAALGVWEQRDASIIPDKNAAAADDDGDDDGDDDDDKVAKKRKGTTASANKPAAKRGRTSKASK